MQHIAFFSELGGTIRKAVTRFPFVVPFLLAVPYGIAVVHEAFSASPAAISVIPLWLILGTAITVLMERLEAKKLTKILAQVILFGLLAGLIAWLQMPHWTDALSLNEGVFVAQLWGLSWLLLLLALMFKAQGTFWAQANTLLTRLLLTIFFGVFIYGLLAVALASASYLLGVNFDGRIYFDVWLIVTAIFGPLFMLGGFPSLKSEDPLNTKITGLLQGIAKYILFPASALYFAILYAYTAKILITQQWPTGTLAFMILGFSTLLIISYGILYGKIEQMQRGALWTKLLFLGLVPQVVMLFITAGIRIEDVGLTEKRYLLLMAGVWLTIVSAYFIFSRKRRLEAIPLILVVLLFLSMFGPWGMLDASKNSQVAELQSILTAHNAFQNGKVVKQSFDSSMNSTQSDDSYKVQSILWFLESHDGLSALQPWFTEDITNKNANDIGMLIGTDTYGSMNGSSQITYCTLRRNSEEETYKKITGYDYEFFKPSMTSPVRIMDKDKTYEVHIDGTTISPMLGTENLGNITLEAFMQDAVTKNCIGDAGYKVAPLNSMTYHYENAKVRFQVVFDEITADKEKEGTFKNLYFEGSLYITFK